jgi:hypothetical protein
MREGWTGLVAADAALAEISNPAATDNLTSVFISFPIRKEFVSNFR